MFDIGGPELFIVAIVTLLVVGPEQIPRVVRFVVGFMRKMRGIASDFQSSLTEIADQADIKKMAKDIEKSVSDETDFLGGKSLSQEWQEMIDPDEVVQKTTQDLETAKEQISNDIKLEDRSVNHKK